MNTNERMEDTECWCCPMMDICTKDFIPKTTRDMFDRSNCGGGFLDGFEDVI